MVLETDVSFAGKIADFTSRLSLPVDHLFPVQFDFNTAPLEGDPVVVPFPGRI